MLAASLANPDGYVAARNIDRWQETGTLDVRYLSGLSADAAGELAALPPDLRAPALARLEDRLADDEPWSSWNLARARARSQIG